MAENARPLNACNKDYPRLDLSKAINFSPSKRPPMATNRSFTNSSGLLSPPLSQTASDYGGADLAILTDPSRTLISPPPEEELRRGGRESTAFSPALNLSTFKRKRSNAPTLPHLSTITTSPTRTGGTPLEATPNPKPRKQVRHQRTGSDASLPSPTRATATTTPVPKPRQRTLVDSPHTGNPDANYIPPYVATASEDQSQSQRRRRSTKSPSIPPYEPPNEVFTPPREIILTPSPSNQSSASKRKSAAKKKGRHTLKLDTTLAQIKKEPPEIDLSEPMPPASPTDDPLLLSGPPEEDISPRRQRERPISPFNFHRSSPAMSQREKDIHPFLRSNSSPFKSAAQCTPRGVSPAASTLPPSSPIDDELPSDAPQFMPAPLSSEESMEMDQPIHSADYDGPLPMLFNDNADSDVDSDAESEAEKTVGNMRMGEGEYTGKWTDYFVHTQRDPPSSTTKMRREVWGNPVSPYPFVRTSFISEGPVKGRLSNVVESREDEEVRQSAVMEAESEDDSLPASDPPEDRELSRDDDMNDEEEAEVREMSMERELPIDDESDHDDEEEREVREMSIEKDSPLELSLDQPEEEALEEVNLAPAQKTSEPREPSPAPAYQGNFYTRSPAPEAQSTSVHRSSVPFPNLSRLSSGFPRRVPLVGDDAESPAAQRTVFGDDSLFKTPAPLSHRASRASTSFLRTEDLNFAVDDDQRGPSVDADSSGDSDSEIDADASVVKITSSDPRAAARAAAILKQHDYDCYTRIEAKRRRSQTPHKSIGEFAKTSRRKTLGDSAISKANRRKSHGGVIGEVVLMPDSPAVTLKGLLRSVEKDVAREREHSQNEQASPLPSRLLHMQKWKDQTAEWTKDNWKLLDMCFTDERYEVGGGEEMATADAVSLDNVVERFVEIIEEVYWPWDELLDRARALRKKQRGGSIAPPSRPSTPAPMDVSQRRPTLDVPDFTPLGRRAMPPRKPRLLPGVKSSVPALLMAPRYSHLLEEARNVEHVPRRDPPQDAASNISVEQETAESSYEDESSVEHTPSQELSFTPERSNAAFEEPASIGKRMRGLLFSYLPTLSTKSAAKPRRAEQQPGLPLPPEELLHKSWGPIVTPARSIPVKPRPPKELVNLHHAPLPHPASRLPRPRPKRLVELQPVPEPPPEPREEVIRPRRSSGSVKDLVKGFEELDSKRKSTGSIPPPKLKGTKIQSKPLWKP